MKMNTYAQVVVLFPFEPFLSDSEEILVSKIKLFQELFPGMKEFNELQNFSLPNFSRYSIGFRRSHYDCIQWSF